MSDCKKSVFGRLARRVWPRKRRRRGGEQFAERLGFEALESRRVLAAVDAVPSIQGTVYVDTNANGMPDGGEELADVTIQLFVDDGDGIFEPEGGDVQIGPDQVTDANGRYCFDGIDGLEQYFIVQPAQTVDGIDLDLQVSDLIEPGTPNLIIDSFRTNQTVEASPPAPSSDGSTLGFPDENEVIGAERDLFVELVSGVGEVQLVVNPFNLLEVLQFNSSSGVQGSAIVTWDGEDFDANPIPSMGLGGRDLTQGGINTGFAMQLGIDTAGMGEVLTLSLFQGNAANVSSVSVEIPVTDGTASEFLFVPFSDFSGPVSPSNVDAIQLSLGMESVPSADGQVSFLGVIGPKIFDVANAGGADLAISKSNETTTIVPGESVSYEIIVQNLGPQDVIGASVQDDFPATLTNVSYTSTVSGTVSGNTPNGNGNINDTIDMTVGSSVTYVVTADVDPDARGNLVNTASVAPPVGTADPNPSNNSDTETDTLRPEVDLRIVKTNEAEVARPGQAVGYTITVSNQGPSSVRGARIEDSFPADLLNVSYTSEASDGSVSGNTPSGTGNIDDLVDMDPGSSMVYTVTGTLADSQADVLSNTATVTTPEDTIELNPNDNTSTHNDPIVREVDLTISKTNDVASVTPGQSLTYEIVVQNLGPSNALGAIVQDVFPVDLQGVSYTSTATGGATGNTSGNGDIADSVDMPAGSSITYAVTATVSNDATGELSNTATVVPPADRIELNPENNSATHRDMIVPTVDLAVTKSDNVTVVRPNDVLTYEITVSNAGPSRASGARLVDVLPAELTNISYTSAATGGASGNTLSGTGDLDETLDMPQGANVTYTVMATVREAAAIDVVNTVTVTAPEGTVDSNPANNTATDIDQLLPGVDLAITKTNNVDVVFAGGETTYTIVVTNNGPNGVVGAEVSDLFPAELTQVSYASVAAGGATGGSSGSGHINDTVDLPVGSSITYTVQAAIDPQATGQLVNQATVMTPDGFTELNPNNNSSTDTDRIDQALAQISGFVYVDWDDDGIRDPGEPPLPGVEILLEQDDTEIDSVLTDSRGFYQFVDLEADTYDVVQIQPEGFADGKMTVGGDIGQISGPNRFTVPLQPGDHAEQLNFGELPLQPSKRSLLASRFRSE